MRTFGTVVFLVLPTFLACGGSNSHSASTDAKASGGLTATGGIPSGTGGVSTGGVTATGGRVSTGGLMSTGGISATGGLVSTGGLVQGTGGVRTGGIATGGIRTGGTIADGSVSTSGGADAGVDAPMDTRPPVDSSGMDSSSLPPPTFALEMVKADQSRIYSRATNGGSATLGVAHAAAADNAVAELVFKGDSTLGPQDKLSPEFATEIGTNDKSFGYGTYRMRVQLGACAANEELVNGIFTYFNDGKDHDGDGLIDNSEIDIEILCSDPSIISLTIWTQYTSDAAGKNRHVSRAIHTKTGAYEDTRDFETPIGSGSNPDFKRTFPDPNAFYDMGFEWHAQSVRFFMVFDGKEVTLWTFTEAKSIPSLPAAFLFNIWHATDWWNSKGIADYPAGNSTLRVDWFRYWKD